MQINLPLYREHFNIVYNKLYITFKPVLSYTYPPPDSGVFFIFIGDIPIKGLNTELTKTKKNNTIINCPRFKFTEYHKNIIFQEKSLGENYS